MERQQSERKYPAHLDSDNYCLGAKEKICEQFAGTKLPLSARPSIHGGKIRPETDEFRRDKNSYPAILRKWVTLPRQKLALLKTGNLLVFLSPCSVLKLKSPPIGLTVLSVKPTQLHNQTIFV
ncbi:MAG: hypothetical protein ACKVUS_00390 [Saprospiraceae bacterium]